MIATDEARHAELAAPGRAPSTWSAHDEHQERHSGDTAGCEFCAEGLCEALPDPDTIVTPAAKRRAVLAALRERATIGDTLARGAVEVIAYLEAQANGLAWDSVEREIGRAR